MTHIWQGLQSGQWLTSARARGYSLILLGIYAIAVVGWIAVYIPRVSECFEDAVRRRTRQPDLLGDFGNSGAVTLIECGQRIEAADECSYWSGRFHGSIL